MLTLVDKMLYMLWDPEGEGIWCLFLAFMVFVFCIQLRTPQWTGQNIPKMSHTTRLAALRKEHSGDGDVLGAPARASVWRVSSDRSIRTVMSRDGSVSRVSNIPSSASNASRAAFSRAASDPSSSSSRSEHSTMRRLSSCSCDRCSSAERRLHSPPTVDIVADDLAAQFQGQRNSWGGIWALRVWPACASERCSLSQGIEVPATSGEVEDTGSLTLTTANGFVDNGELLVCLGGILQRDMPQYRKCVLLGGGGGFVNGNPVSTVSWNTLETSRDEKPWSGTLTMFPCLSGGFLSQKQAGDSRVMGLVLAVCAGGTEAWAFKGRRVVAM